MYIRRNMDGGQSRGDKTYGVLHRWHAKHRRQRQNSPEIPKWTSVRAHRRWRPCK